MDNNPVAGTLAPGDPHGNPALKGASLVAAIRGPVLLIAIGILFALDYSAGIRFWKTWPVLLIVIGVLHLMERRAGSRT